jgi:hypothetical protein
MAEYFQHVQKNSEETRQVTNIRMNANVGLSIRACSTHVLILNLKGFKCGKIYRHLFKADITGENDSLFSDLFNKAI